jgi:hypothetical protein
VLNLLLRIEKRQVLNNFTKTFSQEQLNSIEAVCIDMWDPYFVATIVHVPDAPSKTVYGRFHVMREFLPIDRYKHSNVQKLQVFPSCVGVLRNILATCRFYNIFAQKIYPLMYTLQKKYASSGLLLPGARDTGTEALSCAFGRGGGVARNSLRCAEHNRQSQTGGWYGCRAMSVYG